MIGTENCLANEMGIMLIRAFACSRAKKHILISLVWNVQLIHFTVVMFRSYILI